MRRAHPSVRGRDRADATGLTFLHVTSVDAVTACSHLFGHLRCSAGGRPRANCNAYPASLCLIEIRDALIEIDIPFLNSPHRVLLALDGIGWARRRANLAICAEIVSAEHVRRVGRERHVGQYAGEPEG